MKFALLISLLAITFYECKLHTAVHHEVLKEFKEVNASIDSSQQSSKKNWEKLYDKIKESAPSNVITQADLINNGIKATYEYLDTLKGEINHSSIGIEDTIIGYKTIITKIVEEKMKFYFSKIQNELSVTNINNNGIPLNDILNHYHQWAKKDFKNAPAIAVISMLSKYQNDLRHLQEEVYKEILQNNNSK